MSRRVEEWIDLGFIFFFGGLFVFSMVVWILGVTGIKTTW